MAKGASTNGKLKKLDDWTNEHRPLALLSVGALILATVAVFDWANNFYLLKSLFYPARATVADVRYWSALVYGEAFVMGLPVAFLLWHWRDRNVRDQIENARKDINLKEFQEVQLRAAGALDEKLPQEAREQLQIAALHQLRGFLRGDYGPSFKRPAFELLLGGHAAAIHRIGVPQVQQHLIDNSNGEVMEEVQKLRDQLTPIDRTRMSIIRDEAEYIFTSIYPLDGRCFDLLNMKSFQFEAGLDLSSSHFFGTELSLSRFTNVNLRWANLEAANLSKAQVEHTDMTWVNLAHASLVGAQFERVDLAWALLEGTDLTNANLQNIKLHFAELQNAKLNNVSTDDESEFTNAWFNSDTQFGTLTTGKRWNLLTAEEKEDARAPWIARGMVNNDPFTMTD